MNNESENSIIYTFVSVAEYLGEKLAYFFGITSPKYQYVIDEYYRQKELVCIPLTHSRKTAASAHENRLSSINKFPCCIHNE